MIPDSLYNRHYKPHRSYGFEAWISPGGDVSSQVAIFKFIAYLAPL